jgi:hypothetical protein
MQVFENQEAFALASKRIKARILRATQLEVGKLDSKGLTKLADNLTTAKAIETNQHVDKVRAGQEYYVQLLLDAVTKPVTELVQAEYDNATMELGTTDEILASLEALQMA